MSQNSWSLNVLALRYKTNIDIINFANTYYLDIISIHCLFFQYATWIHAQPQVTPNDLKCYK
jgi:hypothetical protein